MRGRLLFIILYTIVAGIPATSQTIITYAGTGVAGYAGDGGPATAARLQRPNSMAFAPNGDMYIADGWPTHAIRKISKATGIITTIAGGITSGFSGNGGPAMAALLDDPWVIACDPAGNIYFVDQQGCALRRIDAVTGIITNLYGGPMGPGIIGYSGDGGPIGAATFNRIIDLVFDNAGTNLYISDFANMVIRKLNIATGIVTTVVGSGARGFAGDGGLATAAAFDCIYGFDFDNAGNMYINDQINLRVRKVDAATGIVTTIAGNGTVSNTGDGGPASAATIWSGYGLRVDNSNNVYISVGYSVRKIDAVTGIISRYAGDGVNIGYSGDGGPPAAALVSALSLAIDANNDLYIGSLDGSPNFGVIRKITCLNVAATLQPIDAILCNTGNARFIIAAPFGPNYRWQVNTGAGWNNITNNATYAGATTNTLDITGATTAMNGYQYRCNTTNACRSEFSSPATLTVNTRLTPTVSVAASATTICSGTNVNFTSTISNGGPTPAYQWRKNGNPVGTNSPAYSDNTLNNNDQVTCALTGSLACVTGPTAASNVITMNVNALLTPTISISTASAAICDDAAAGFTSVITNGGSAPSYQWKKNGGNVGTNSNAYTDNTLSNGDIISCVLSSNAGCVATPTGSSNTIAMTVHPKPDNFLADDTSFCSYETITLAPSSSFSAYTWSNGSNSSSVTINQPGPYWLDVRDNNNCTGRNTILVTLKECREGLFTPNAFTPNNDGLNDTFRPMVFGTVKRYEFQVYNQWGNMVFSTKDLSKGWDGRFKGSIQKTNVFVWVCSYQLDGKPAKTEKGTVLVIQ